MPECSSFLMSELKLQIIVETDALSIVNSINENFIEGSIGHLIQGILVLLNSFSSWKVIHVKRDHNRAAHEAAHLARRSEDSQVWIGALPIALQEIVQSERIM
ncbi:hypothetical protein SO802_018193 [Lithocarpus litseifolius]|uniref:RNase H type-1 domain-containing protein n=1 Tax=Lithocarpus litseifolius TaxID=425828 RepID=A0AAW2CNI0_9ROSI